MSNEEEQKNVKVVVREFRKRDLDQVAIVAHRAFQSEADKYWSVVGALRAPKTLVAEVNGRIVGVIEFEVYRLSNSLEGHIWYIFVDPSFQRKGIGSLLLKHAENWIAEKGAKRVWAITGSYNIPTQKFFEKNNYRRMDIAEMKKILGSKNTKRFLRRMIYWEGDIIYMKELK